MCCVQYFLFVITCVLALELGAKNEYVLGSRVLAYLGLPRLPNWIVPSDMADLHNLVVSFTASHGLGDEWQPQKIIFLLGCNKSCVKCSTAYITMAKKWQKRGVLLFTFLLVLHFSFLAHGSSVAPMSNKKSKLYLHKFYLSAILINDRDVYIAIARYMYEKFHWSCCVSLYAKNVLVVCSFW